MPIGNVSRDNSAPKRETFRPPWVKEKDTESPPPWTQRKLKPVEAAKPAPEPTETPIAKPLKPALKKQATVKEKAENGVTASEPTEEKLVKPSAAKLADKNSRPADEKPRFLKSTVKTIDKTNDKIKSEEKPTSDKLPERPILKSVRTIDDKNKDKSVTIVDKNDIAKNTNSVNEKTPNGKVTTNSLSKPSTKVGEKTPLKSKVDEKVLSKPKVEEKITSKVEDKVKEKSKPDVKQLQNLKQRINLQISLKQI